MPTLSPIKAAKRIGLSRRSIMRAIESGALSAWRDNKNMWQIEEEALAQWAPSEPVERPEKPSLSAQAEAVLTERIVGLERLLAEMRENHATVVGQLRTERDEMRADRDEWRSIAQRIAQQKDEERERPQYKPWYRRLVG